VLLHLSKQEDALSRSTDKQDLGFAGVCNIPFPTDGPGYHYLVANLAIFSSQCGCHKDCKVFDVYLTAGDKCHVGNPQPAANSEDLEEKCYLLKRQTRILYYILGWE
jgi:hypothetical protein